MHFAKGCEDFNFSPTNGFSIKPLKVKLLAGEQKATKFRFRHYQGSFVGSDLCLSHTHADTATGVLFKAVLGGNRWRFPVDLVGSYSTRLV